jgi:hypothetical protein
MKVTITIKEEDSQEERTIIVHSLSGLDEIERLINQAITKEAIDKGWVVVKKPEASGPSEPLLGMRPSAYLIDEMGVWNFDKKGTKDLWGKIVKKPNNGNKIY